MQPITNIKKLLKVWLTVNIIMIIDIINYCFIMDINVENVKNKDVVSIVKLLLIDFVDMVYCDDSKKNIDQSQLDCALQIS